MIDRKQVVGFAIAAVLIAAGVFAGAMTVAGGNNDTTAPNNTTDRTVVENPPAEVNASQPLAKAFYTRVNPRFDGSHVYIRRDGSLVMQYNTSAGSPSALESELHRIAFEYATVVKNGEHQPKTLSIVTRKVKVIAPGPTVAAYANGTINKEAYLKTIEVTDIERAG